MTRVDEQDLMADNVWWLAGRMYLWLVNPARKLPIGVTLAEIAADGLAKYVEDVDECLSAFGAQVEERGARFGFARTAATRRTRCRMRPTSRS